MKRDRELQASREREDRLKRLYETQRQSMERNLRQQQRRRELRGGDRESSGGIHIHIQDTTDSVRGEGFTIFMHRCSDLEMFLAIEWFC